MNLIPEELIALPGFHGYFWNPDENQLYSAKYGKLKTLKRRAHLGSIRKRYSLGWGYFVSDEGRRRFICETYLKGLTKRTYVVPYA